MTWLDTLNRRAHDPETVGDAGYQVLMDLVDDGFCIIQFIDGPSGPQSNYVHVESNSGYARHTGITDIVGKTVFDVSPDDGAEWVKIYHEVLRTGVPIRFERRFAEVGRHIEVSATRVEPPSKAQVAVLFRDVTARKLAEQTILDSEQRAVRSARQLARALAAGAILGTWVWVLDENRFDIDDGFSRAMGLEPGAAAADGLTLDAITRSVHADDRPALLAAVDRAIAGGLPIAFQFRVKRDDGRYHWVETNGRIEEHGPRVFAGVLMDLDDRRAILDDRDRATAEILRLNQTLEQRVAEQTARLMAQEEALRQAQKMEAVGQLTGGLAHDFNNLLTAISGSLELIAQRLREGRTDEAFRFLATARSSADRAATVTQRLLAFSRRQSLQPAPTDLSDLVRGMEDLIRHSMGPEISVETRFEPESWIAMVDGNQLENALLNLCLNARDAMPEGGSIFIDLENRRLGAEQEEVAPGEYLALCVRDTGCGMTSAQIVKAFDPYFTTKPIGKGTGLGLSMVYGFARQSGGAAVINSQLGQGTQVQILLPRSDRAVELAAPVPVAERAAEVQGTTILVVDDEVLVRMVVNEALTDAGFTVIEAGTGAEGLQHLAASPEISILLTDVGLPGGMTGRELAAQARAGHPDLRIVFMTGYDDEATTSPALDRTMVLLKPFEFEVMVQKMMDVAATPHG